MRGEEEKEAAGGRRGDDRERAEGGWGWEQQAVADRSGAGGDWLAASSESFTPHAGSAHTVAHM